MNEGEDIEEGVEPRLVAHQCVECSGRGVTCSCALSVEKKLFVAWTTEGWIDRRICTACGGRGWVMVEER